MNVLGIWDGHDSGAALLVDGRVVAAVNEGRLTRRKLEIRFPVHSIAMCLSMAGLRPSDINAVAASTADVAKTLGRWLPWTKEQYYAVRRRKSKPGRLATLTRRAKYRLTRWPPNGLSRRLSLVILRRECERVGLNGVPITLVDHHECHALAAACASGFTRCSVVTIDGLGDGLSATTSVYRDGVLTRVASSPASDSLGVFFEHVTALLNMRELEDEGKVMALAEYAAPVDDKDNPLLDLITVDAGRIRMRARGQALADRLKAIHWHYANEQFAHMAQRVVERTVVALVVDAVERTGESLVALAGGVASNIKATRLARLLPTVKGLYVFPHMGDGGLALGAALALVARTGARPALELSRLDVGPAYADEEIASTLARQGLKASRPDDLEREVASRLAQDAVVLWFQGGMEYGPRALGHRSALAKPTSRAIRDRLNLVLKRRVYYQPFCPSMLESEAARLFEDWSGPANPHMTMAYVVRPEFREDLTGVIGVDGSCRPHIVSDAADGRYARLLRLVKDEWGYGVVLNTSFNIHGEPMVCTPDHAVVVYERSGADALAIGSYLVECSHS